MMYYIPCYVVVDRREREKFIQYEKNYHNYDYDYHIL